MRLWRWFSEPVPTARGWFYLAVGFGLLALGDLVGWLV